jgi:hypothetical protein
MIELSPSDRWKASGDIVFQLALRRRGQFHACSPPYSDKALARAAAVPLNAKRIARRQKPVQFIVEVQPLQGRPVHVRAQLVNAEPL